ncbi:MAG: hypothetical protein JHC87_00500 [Thermoleophilaceae bacterium]|nr:hypothetical protein [Thermoleophilaceae bacterium]
MNSEPETQPSSSKPKQFGELERLLGQLREQVDALRGQELDPEQLQQALGELNDLAAKASVALNNASN